MFLVYQNREKYSVDDVGMDLLPLQIQPLIDGHRTSGVMKLMHPRYVGSLELRTSLSITGGDLASLPIISGPVHCDGSDVVFQSIEFSQQVTVADSVANVLFDACTFHGPVRFGANCSDIVLRDCSIILARSGLGVSLTCPSGIRIEKCVFRDNLVALSVQEEAVASHTFVDDAGFKKPQCLISDCVFEGNATDVVVRFSWLTGADGAYCCTFFPASLLVVETADSELTFDVSVSGKLETPLSLREWPLPKLDLTLPRRGSRRSKRNCFLRTTDNGSLHVWEDPSTIEDADLLNQQRKKKTRKMPQPSRAESLYCGVLGVPVGASLTDVHAAFKKLALVHHPDKTGGTDSQFIRIRKARDELTSILQNR